LRKIFTIKSFLERFQKMHPELGAVDHGAEIMPRRHRSWRRGLGSKNNISYLTLKFFCEEIYM
jgi:hypothetical protein